MSHLPEQNSFFLVARRILYIEPVEARKLRGFEPIRNRLHSFDRPDREQLNRTPRQKDARPLAAAVKTVLDPQGKPDLPLDRVVDATIVEEVLRERR